MSSYLAHIPNPIRTLTRTCLRIAFGHAVAVRFTTDSSICPRSDFSERSKTGCFCASPHGWVDGGSEKSDRGRIDATPPSDSETGSSDRQPQRLSTHRAMIGCATMAILAACSNTDVPAISGTVVDQDTQRPVTEAEVFVRYSGATEVREKWFHALTGLQGARCIRWMVTTNDLGRFNTSPTKLSRYFGSPTVQFVIYRDGFRQRLGGVSQQAVDPQNVALTMWTESSAERYDSASGQVVEYASLDDPQTYRATQTNRHHYLDRWLALSGLTDECDFDPDLERIQLFLLERFEEWLATSPASISSHRKPAACSALMAFHFAHERPELIQRFRAMKSQASEKLCSATTPAAQ